MNNGPDTRNANSVLLGFLVGSIVGAGVALLLAPATGEETRRRLGDTARRVGNDAKSKYGEVKDRLAHGISDVKNDLHDAVEAGKSSAQRLASRIPSDTNRNLNG